MALLYDAELRAWCPTMSRPSAVGGRSGEAGKWVVDLLWVESTTMTYHRAASLFAWRHGHGRARAVAVAPAGSFRRPWVAEAIARGRPHQVMDGKEGRE